MLIYPTYENRIITVTGNGEISVKPDFVQIQIGVVTQSMNVAEAQQENAVKMNRIIQGLLNQNIAREDIQTQIYNVFPRYDFVEGKQVFHGIEVTNVVTVKIRNIEQVGIIIDTAIQNGANQVSQLEFKIEHEDAYYRMALQLAFQDASKKAIAIAEQLRLTYMPIPIDITEVSLDEPVLYRATASVESFNTPIEQGMIEVRGEVRVKYHY